MGKGNLVSFSETLAPTDSKRFLIARARRSVAPSSVYQTSTVDLARGFKAKGFEVYSFGFTLAGACEGISGFFSGA